jgi:hypothetical protein
MCHKLNAGVGKVGKGGPLGRFFLRWPCACVLICDQLVKYIKNVKKDALIII